MIFDYETRSLAELRGPKSVGLWNYAHDSSTKVLLLAYAFKDEDVKVWQPHLESIPEEVLDALNDPKEELIAFNSTFERYITNFVLKIPVAAERFQDIQPSARYLSLPADLDSVGEILGLPQDKKKDERGRKLIQIFCKPTIKKKKGQEPQVRFRDWESDPDLWQEFIEYARQDVVTEREDARRLKLLKVFPLPPKEQEIWLLDQKINDRGIPVDIQFVQSALKLATREKHEAIAANNEKTGLENSNSNSQLIEWAKTQGYNHTSLDKDIVTAQLKYNENITPLCRDVLEARRAASSTSYKKLSAIQRQVCQDGRLRNQFIYMGSARCGRWSGNSVQLHNLARPVEIFEDEKNIDEARSLIKQEDYDRIRERFGSVLLTVKSNIRTAFATNPTKRFNVADLASIETRVGAWISNCQPLLDVFIKGRDAYLDFAVKMTGIPYEKLEADLHNKVDAMVKAAAKKYRQMAKPAVLGAIYRLGGGDWSEDDKGNPIKTGLWGYAEAMGVEMTREQAHEIVRVFRESYREIVECWYAFEKAISDVLKPGTVYVKREVGPTKIDKLIINQEGRERILLRIQLPSGRFLHYFDAHIKETKMPWTQKDPEGNVVEVYRPALWYSNQSQTTKQWVEVTSHGGHIFQNVTQGIARDVLAEKLLVFEKEGLPVVLHVHDEGGTETDDDIMEPSYREMEEIMSRSIDWAPGLPLAAEGFSSAYYHK